MWGILPAWLKWSGAGVLSLALLVAGFQVASWRAGALEAVRLNAEGAKLQAQILELQSRELAADASRVAESFEIEQTEAELKARIADLQEQVKLNNNPDCDFPEEAVGILNRAAGHGPKNKE